MCGLGFRETPISIADISYSFIYFLFKLINASSTTIAIKLLVRIDIFNHTVSLYINFHESRPGKKCQNSTSVTEAEIWGFGPWLQIYLYISLWVSSQIMMDDCGLGIGKTLSLLDFNERLSLQSSPLIATLAIIGSTFCYIFLASSIY